MVYSWALKWFLCSYFRVYVCTTTILGLIGPAALWLELGSQEINTKSWMRDTIEA